MKLRHLTIAVAAASCVFALSGCKPIDKNAGGDKKAEETGKGGVKIPGLPTEKDQVSYLIGMEFGGNLKDIKDEVSMEAFNKGLRDGMAGKKPPMTNEQAAKIMQAFGARIQAKKQAEAEAASKKNAEAGTRFLEENGKKKGVTTTASGLQYEVVTQGTGPKPKADDVVKVHYRGKLLDGTTFDSSYDRNEPAQFQLNQVVPGWTEALQLMPVGSKYKLWIPAKLGYGEAGTPGGPIPPNSTLSFEVELLEIVKQQAQPPMPPQPTK